MPHLGPSLTDQLREVEEEDDTCMLSHLLPGGKVDMDDTTRLVSERLVRGVNQDGSMEDCSLGRDCGQSESACVSCDVALALL